MPFLTNVSVKRFLIIENCGRWSDIEVGRFPEHSFSQLHKFESYFFFFHFPCDELSKIDGIQTFQNVVNQVVNQIIFLQIKY